MAIKINGATVIDDSQNFTSTGTISATGNIVTSGTIKGNIQSTGPVSTTGTVTGGNILTGGIVSATGNITGNFIFGNGSQLTGIDATSIQSGTSNVRVVSSGGNVTTSVGGSSNVVVVATTGQFVAGVVSATGDVTSASNLQAGGAFAANGIVNVFGQFSGPGPTVQILGSAGTVSAVGNITGSNLLTAGTISATGNITGGNVLTGGFVSATGNITGGNLSIGSDAVITGNLTVNGTTTTVNSNTVTINDKFINVANNASTSTLANGGGLGVGPVGSEYAKLEYDQVANTWDTNIGLSVTGIASATGNISTSGQFNGSGAGLTSIPNGALSNSSVTVNGTAIALGGSGTVTANAATLTGTALNSTVVTSSLTSVGTLGSLSVTGTATVGNLATAGTVSATGNITGGNLSVGTGTVTVGNIVNANGNGVGNIGSSTTYFNTVFAKATSAQYADLAEKYTADADYEPGTVVMFGGTAEVTLCANDGCSRVAGVISTNPSYIMNGTLDAPHVATVALTGRVPTKVTGTVRKGDLMVSAGNGSARAEANPRVGTVIGKALADHDGAEGVIEVVVGRF